MAKSKLSAAAYVEKGYGQVEPNHLSAQRTGQIYAQLPAAAAINVLENGQFVKYDYAAGVCDFVGKGEWMLVFNEVKVYRDYETDQDFAMLKDDYHASVYSPVGSDDADLRIRDYRDIAKAADPYEVDSTTDPFHIGVKQGVKLMPENTSMVPRVFKTNVGDIFTTNMIDETELAIGDILAPQAANGILKKAEDDADMKWEVVKIYTMPDHQKGVKVMRIA